MKYCFGVDIGGTTVKLGLFSEAGAIVEKWEIVTRTEDEGSAILPDIAEAINGKLEQHGIEKEQILGIGVGPVTADGIVNGSANLGWKYKNAKKELEELTDLKEEFGNDANVAALGEMWKGGGVGYRNMIMVTLGTGVGGGIIINGKILTGENGAGGIWKRQILADVADTDVWSSMHQQQVSLVLQERRWSMRHVQQS